MEGFKKGFVFFFLLVVWSSVCISQINTGILPDSFTKKVVTSETIDHIFVEPPDMEKIMMEDAEDAKNGTFYKISRLLDIDISFENSGTWNRFDDGSEFWSVRLESPDAEACALHFANFSLPRGSQLFAYNPDKSMILGPYTYDPNSTGNEFSIGILKGGDIILEYYPPEDNLKNEFSLPEFQLTQFSYIYRDAGFLLSEEKGPGYGDSDYCQININCSQGNNWRDQQKGVARIYLVIGQSGGWCTGSLVNNTLNNGTPYFLTADHCGGSASAANMNQWMFFFNYEAPTCSYSGAEPAYNVITGCSKISSGPISGGSDFLLLQLNTTPLHIRNIGGIYNGWRRTNLGSSSGVGIHHPMGDIKKISTYSQNLVSTTWPNGGASGAAWGIYWSSGVTEGGSSGSPLFDSNGLIIGTLTGGSSTCQQPNNPDVYGKFSYHWASNGATDVRKLQPWLDPNNTGSTTCPIYDPNSTTLNADFSASPTQVAVGGTVNFTDLSSGAITYRSWTFPGGTPSSSNQTNPSVVYNTEGTYSVSLTIYEGASMDTETKNGYITVTASGCPPIIQFPYGQNFNSSSLPSCWNTQISNSNKTWQNTSGYTIGQVQIAPQSGSHFYYCPWDDNQSQDEWLITPSFDFSNITSPEISFYFSGSYYWSVSPNDHCDLDLMVSVDGGTWTKIWSETDNPAYNSNAEPYAWIKTELDLTNYQGQNDVKFAFRYSGFDGANFAIDNVRIDGEEVVLNQYTLTINKTGNGSVNVDGNPYSSPVVVDEGTVLALQAIADQGWEFVEWTGNLSGNNNPQNLVMNENKTVNAIFQQSQQEQFTLTVNIEGEGNVKVNDVVYTGPVSFNSGEIANIVAMAEEDWEFDKWTGDITGNNESESITMNENKSVNAIFTEASDIFIEKLQNEIYIYPNPTYGMINIKLPENTRAEASLMNILGKELKSFQLNDENTQIDLSNFAKGLYIFKIQHDDISIIRKVTLK